MDPHLSSNFHVELDGMSQGSFREFSGVESSIAVVSYREGGDPVTRKLPGNVQFSNLVLTRGLVDSSYLYDWYEEWVTGDPQAQRKSGSIVLLDRRFQEVMRWDFKEAWPVKWSGPTFNAEGSDVAVERFELAHHGIRLAR